MKCYRCKSENIVKAGFIRGLQRCKCKECGCHFRVEIRPKSVKTEEQRRMALDLYAEY